MMSQKFFINSLVAVVAIFGFFYWFSTREDKVENKVNSPMTITSPAFKDGESIPDIYTCDGSNINPPLEFTNVPVEAKSLALVVNDPDAPSGNWVHWAVWNIPPTSVGLHAGEKIAGAVEGLTSFGRNGYGGPCPSTGEHRYVFKLYALNTTLRLQSVYGIKLEKTIESQVIESAVLEGKYQRAR
jgi:hypothetical protein